MIICIPTFHGSKICDITKEIKGEICRVFLRNIFSNIKDTLNLFEPF